MRRVSGLGSIAVQPPSSVAGGPAAGRPPPPVGGGGGGRRRGKARETVRRSAASRRPRAAVCDIETWSVSFLLVPPAVGRLQYLSYARSAPPDRTGRHER